MSIPAIAVASTLGWTLLAPTAAATRERAAVSDLGARRHMHDVVRPRRASFVAPHYYARPIYYRPYPYGVPAPFVLGFGPWW
jgi:hypothetical protein